MYQLIMQFASPLTMKGPGGGDGGEKTSDYWTVSAWGHTPYNALANLSQKVSRKIVFQHTELYVFSERMARTKGVLPVIDGVARSRQSRRTIIVAVTKDNVEKVLTVNLPLDSTNAIGLANQIRLAVKQYGGGTVINVRDFLIRLNQPGQEPCAVALELIEEKEEKDTGPGIQPPIRISGRYLFKDDKVVGFFNNRETRGCNWVLKQVKFASLVLKYPGREDVLVDVIATGQDSRIEPVIENGKPAIRLSIKAEGKINNITGLSELKEESILTESLEKRMAEVIRNDIKIAVKKLQELKTDEIGFGFAFYREKYALWKEMEDNWDELFASLPVEIEVNANIRRIGLVNKGPDIR
jgi:spore germination protein KC